MTKKQSIESIIEKLLQTALQLGASQVKAISPSDISIEQNLADLCKEPGCENYGLSPSCPPHVSGPIGFKKLQKKFRHAIVFKIDVPSEILLSDERREVFKLLHEVASGIERKAFKLGYGKAKAFAGGSCKNIFCHGHTDCYVLKKGGECRNPEFARPSMSGFGINVSKLMKTAGMSMSMVMDEKSSLETSMGSVTGLVLIC